MEGSRSVCKFFELIGRDQDDEALDLFRLLVFPNGDEVPSPSAQMCMESGDWDKKLSVRLYYVSDASCCKQIGKATPAKMCARHSSACTIKSHLESGKRMITEAEVGWRIGLGSTISEGVLVSPFLFGEDRGGPITADAAARFNTGLDPFTMPVAHWTLLFQVYYEDMLQTPTSEKVVVETVDENSSTLSKPTLTRSEKEELGIKVPVAPPAVPSQFSFDRPAPPVKGLSNSSVSGDSLGSTSRLQMEVIRLARTVEGQGKDLAAQLVLIEQYKLAMDEQGRLLGIATSEFSKLKGEVDRGIRATQLSQTRLSSTVTDLRTDMQTLETSLGKVEIRVDEASAQALAANSGTHHLAERVRSGGSVRFHNRSFGSPEEFVRFCTTNRIGLACSADAFLLMNMDRNQVVAEEDSLKNRKGRTDTKIGTGIESLFVSSFDTSFPATLSPSKASVGDSASAVQVLKKLLKDAYVWESEDGSEGVRYAIEASVATIGTRISEFADGSGMNVHGEHFCGKLLADSERFVSSLLTFVSKFYMTTLRTSGLQEGPLWEICLEILGCILKEIVTARNAYVDSAASNPSLYYWGMLQAWRIQQRFLDNRFLDDPALTGILVRRALLRKDETLIQLEKEVRTLQVYVIVNGGFEWVLSWRQIGARSVRIVLGSPSARDQWEALKDGFGGHLGGCEVIESLDSLSDESGLVCTEVRGEEDVVTTNKILQGYGGRVVVISVGMRRKEHFLGKLQPGRMWSKRKVQHTKLGGLTSAVMWLCFSPGFTMALGSDENPLSNISYNVIVRSRKKFLEPSVRLSLWTRSSHRVTGPVWDSTVAESHLCPAPWPIDCGLILKVYSVLVKADIFRKVTDKEWAQFMDLRPEWGCLLRPVMTRDGSCSSAIPLRFFVELGLSVTQQRPKTALVTSDELDLVDFGRQLAPSLLGLGSDAEKQDRVKYFGWVFESEDSSLVQVATKSDNASVDRSLWAIGGKGPELERARERLRSFMWSWWIRTTLRKGIMWLRSQPAEEVEERARDKAAMADCIRRLAHSTWFEWTDGSRLTFWMWPERFVKEARDGAMPHVVETPPRRLVWPSVPQEEAIQEMEAEKLAKLVSRRYLEEGFVSVVIPRMSVPKGDFDCRVVWDMTKNGVNGGTFASSFFLFGIHSLNLRILANAYVGDFDCGEMFNNYTLHESQRHMFGVRLTKEVQGRMKRFLSEQEGCRVKEYMRWARLPFGWRPAPVMSIRMMMRSVELAKGAPEDLGSAFQFSEIVLNLPTMKKYDPGFPRVYKRRKDGLVACEVFIFVDDGRVLGATEALATSGLRQVVSRIQQRGSQDASRKRSPVSQRPRAWTGGVTYTDKGFVRKFLVEKKWNKMKAFVRIVVDAADSKAPRRVIDRKVFESGVGFLVHCSSTYDFLRPYLVGFYLAMNRWRGNRDLDGWKLSEEDVDEEDMDSALEELVDVQVGDEWNPEGMGKATRAETMEPVPVTDLLDRNARTIWRLIESDSPVQLLVRPVNGVSKVAYAGSDASGEGFGTRDSIGGAEGEFVFGFWSSGTDGSSSNWREAKTGLDKIRRDVTSGRLAGREVWFVTDNSTFERAYYKGYSSSLELYMIVEEIRALTLKGNFVLHIVHVAGTRIIETGIDGLSRGEFELNLLKRPLADLLPFAQTPTGRSPSLLAWVRSWAGPDCRLSTPMDWHYEAQQSRSVRSDSSSETWIWDLAPAAALYALEELAGGRTKRHDLLMGVVLVPNIMNPEWFRRFSKSVDCYFRVKPGSIPEWPDDMHEPLLVGIYLPTFHCRPWDWKNVAWMGKLGRAVSAVHSEDDDGEPLVERDTEFDFLRGRDGDDLLCPFECDFCSFERLVHRPSESLGEADKTLMLCIRRAKLDAFWSRRPATVDKTRRSFLYHVRTSQLLGFSAFPKGPAYSEDFDDGLRYAVSMLWKSLEPGRHDDKIKFSAVRGLRSMATNVESVLDGMQESRKVVTKGMKTSVESSLPCDSMWLERFMLGLRFRMGESLRQDLALTPDIVVGVLEECDEEWELAVNGEDWVEARRVAEQACFFVFTYAGGMRGFEVPKVTLTRLLSQFDNGSGLGCRPFIGVPLSGRFKSREGKRANMIIFMVQTTRSGVASGLWIRRLVDVLRREGIDSGWLFQNSEGEQVGTEIFRAPFYERLERCHERSPHLFPSGVNIREDYGPTRSGRRGANSRLIKRVKNRNMIDGFFRWNTGGSETSHSAMHVLYAEKKLLAKDFVGVSFEL